MSRLITFVLVLGVTSNTWCQNSKVDSLQALLPVAKNEKKVDVLHALVVNLWLNYPDSAKIYAREAIQLSDRLNNLRLQSSSNRLMGGAFSYQGEYDSGKRYAKKALELAIKTNDSTLIASASNNFGLTYYFSGSYPEAFEYLLKALNMKLKIGQDYGLGATLNNIGLVYLKVGDYKNARKYFYEAIKVAERIADGNAKLYAFNNIGLTYLLEENYSEAEKFFLESLKITQTINNKNWGATAHDGMAQAYHGLNQHYKSDLYFRQALFMRNEISDKKGISETYFHLSKVHTPAHLDSAFYYLRASHSIAKSIQATDRLLENFEHFKNLFHQARQYDSALHYQSLYVAEKDKQFKENSARSIEGIRLKIQEEATALQLAGKNAQLDRKTLQVNFSVIVAGLLLVFAGTVYWYYTAQRRLGKHLEIVNQKISRQRDEIVQKNEDLKNLNIEKNNLIGIVAHDLKSPLNQIKGLASIIKISSDTTNSETRSYIELIENSANRLTAMIGKILDVEAIESQHLNLTLEPVNLSQVVPLITERFVIQAQQKQLKLHCSLADTAVVKVDRGYTDEVIENVLSNAIKFSPSGKNIYINLTKNDSYVICEIRDEGPGLSEDDKSKLFRKYQKLSASPTANEGSTGLGLSIVKKFVDAMGGEIWCESSLGCGAGFFVKFPAHFG